MSKSSYPVGYLKESQAPSPVRELVNGEWVEVPYVSKVHIIKRSKKDRKAKKRNQKRGRNKKSENKRLRKPVDFYESKAWKLLRAKVLKKYGRQCMKCGDSQGIIQIDHIKPRSKWPELELVFDNMQVLCKPCNTEKSNKNCADYRPSIER